MGNLISHNTNIYELNSIVSYYIFSLSWNNLKKLMNKKYCDKLTIVLNKVLHKYFNLSNNESISLSVLFTKIGHLFACILLNVNPVLINDPDKNILFSKLKHNSQPIHLLPDCQMKSPIILNIEDQLKDLQLLYETEVNNKKVKEIYDNDLDTFNISLSNTKSSTTFLEAFHLFLKNRDKKFDSSKRISLIELYGSSILTFFEKNYQTQSELVEFLNPLFQIKDKNITINDKLTNEQLNKMNSEVRTLILKQNIDCEEFIDTINKIYEALVEQKIFEIANIQIDDLLEQKEALYSQIF